MTVIFTEEYARITGRKKEVLPNGWQVRKSRYVGKTEIIDSEGKVCYLWNTANIKEIQE